ncbi:hypothetical protein P7K49_027638 [Saguinus oedipus]|uniref:Uncharacterized protein n=1 Tax=Saguinus oedipus TaxID=9490 RepID=A0ABQ9UAY5_SAGOE|nr:hypothetical protein P7K49_027638 [Saguinus oedipus]
MTVWSEEPLGPAAPSGLCLFSHPRSVHHLCGTPFAFLSFCRKARGEAKKCRKVYGIEHRDQRPASASWTELARSLCSAPALPAAAVKKRRVTSSRQTPKEKEWQRGVWALLAKV